MRLAKILILASTVLMSLPARARLAIAAAPQRSQPETSRALTGTIVDPSGAAIPAATIILSSPDATELARTTSDSSGSFHFEKLPPAAYRIRILAAGFQEDISEVSIGKKTPAPVRVRLRISSKSEVITVGVQDSAPQVSTEVAENQNANTIDRNALDRVPVFDQDYITTLSRFLDDNATGTNGVSLVVNGVEANGPGVTPSAVQEVKINQNPYSALFSRPGRARLEITTKGGTPDFHGTVNFLYRNSVFDASNAFASSKPPEQRQFYEGSLTGPLAHGKKTSFLLSLDRDVDDTQTFIDAQTLAGPVRENVPAPIRHFFGSGRVFHDWANGDQFWIGYSYEHQSFANQNVGGNILPEAGFNTTFLEHEINVSYRHIFSSKWVNQLRFLVGHYDSPTTSVNEAPQIVVSGAFTGGGAQADARRTEYHFDGTDLTTYSSGKHTLTFGIDVPDISRRGADDFTNTLGTYIFGSLADFQAGIPSNFILQRGQGHLAFLEKTLAGLIEDTIRLKPNFSVTLGLRYYWQDYFHDDPNNLAPRFGFAYAPTKNGKIVMRGGAGIFYDRTGPRPIADLLHFNGVNLLRFIPVTPAFPENPADLIQVPTSVVFLDPHVRIPYTFQYSIGIERQITRKSTFSATYVGSRGMDLFRSLDANAPLPGTAVRPDPAVGQRREIGNGGYQKSNGLELTFRGTPSKYFSGQVQYTLSKTYNNTSGITYFPANTFDPAADWARSDYDRRHKFDLLGSTHLGKWFTAGAALTAYSGRPVNVTTGSDDNHDGVVNDRPAGFARNTLHGPSRVTIDLNLAHDFVFSKKAKEARVLTLSLNSFNVLNHPNDVTYVGVVGSPFFGQGVAAFAPRRMQLNLEFKF